MVDISAYFNRYQWSYEQLEEQIWRTTFKVGASGDFDLFVMADTEWVHFAISPFCPRPDPACHGRLCAALLTLNQQMQLANFGLDEDGDVNLLANMPTRFLSYALFETVMQALVYYTDTLASEVARTATDPTYHPALLNTDHAS